jgi:hypothetical protein
MLMMRGRIYGRLGKKKARLPVNSILPVISGTPVVGQTLTATTGVWAGAQPISYSYQWYRNGVAIPGETSNSYILAPVDADAIITVKVTATNTAGTANINATPVGPVAAVGGGLILTGETDGIGVDFSYATDAHRIVVKTGSTSVGYALDNFFLNGGTSPKLVFDAAGNLGWTRHNLCLQSQSFNQTTPWNPTTAVTFTADAAVAPDGTTTADKIVEVANSSNHQVLHSNIGTIAGATYTFSVYAKAAERSWISLIPLNAAPTDWFDIGTGAIGTSANAGAIASAGNGWYRISITFVATATHGPVIMLRQSNGQAAIYAGDGVSGAYLWGAQLNRGAVPLAYLPTTTAVRIGLAVDYHPTTHAPLGLLCEPATQNLVLNSAVLVTQNIATAASPYTLSFFGTGSVTLSGSTTAGPLTGTGANNRVSLTFTPGAGTVTLTVAGTVTKAQMEGSSAATSYIETFGAGVSRAADNYTFLLSAIPPLGSEYSLYARFASPLPSAGRYVFVVTDGTVAEYGGILSNPVVRFASTDTGGQAGAIAGGTLAADVFSSAAVRMKLNDAAMSTDGAAAVVDNIITLPTVSEVRFGGTGSNAASTGIFRLQKMAIVCRGWDNATLTTKAAA